MTDGFVFYGSFMKALATLDDADRLKAYDAICRYALMDEEPTCDGPALGMFYMAQAQIDANRKKRENGLKGGRPTTEAQPKNNQTTTEAQPKNNQTTTKQEPNDNQSITKQEPKEKVKVKVKDKENLSPKGESQKKAAAFHPPTVEEVRAYCQERGNRVDPEHFVDFYTSKGWKVGNQSMKDWKACVRTWERKDAAPPGKVRPIRKGYEERDYDFDQIEREAFAAMMREG